MKTEDRRDQKLGSAERAQAKKTARETTGRGTRERGRLPYAALPPRVGVRGHWRSLRTYTGTKGFKPVTGQFSFLVPNALLLEYTVN